MAWNFDILLEASTVTISAGLEIELCSIFKIALSALGDHGMPKGKHLCSLKTNFQNSNEIFRTTFKHLAIVGHVSSGLIETSVKEKEDHSVENAQWYQIRKKVQFLGKEFF